MDISQKKILVTILIEVGKFTFTGIVVGYFISTRIIPSWVVIIGIFFSLLCFMIAVYLSKEK